MSVIQIFVLAILLPMFPLVLLWGKAFVWLVLSGWFGLWGAAFYFSQINSKVYDSEYAGMEFLVFISIIVFFICSFKVFSS